MIIFPLFSLFKFLRSISSSSSYSYSNTSSSSSSTDHHHQHQHNHNQSLNYSEEGMILLNKRVKRIRACSCCSSSSYSSSRSSRSRPPFSFYEDDIWIEIAKHLDGKSLVMLASTSKWFYKLLTEEYVWKFACLRDLKVPDPGKPTFSWKYIYITAFDGRHSYLFHQQKKHIDWKRIGAFVLESPTILLTEKVAYPRRIPQRMTTERMLQARGFCFITNLHTGVWIADLQLVRCPVCDLNSCEGTMQTIEMRHCELFLYQGYYDGSWEWKLLGNHETRKCAKVASGAMFDVKHIDDASTSGVFNTKAWIGKPAHWQPTTKMSPHAVAVNTNLQENNGLNTKFLVMRAGPNGKIVAIRISQQLL